MKTWTAKKIRLLKGQSKIVCLTAYDYTMARLVDESGVQLVLVGDSLATTMLGYDTTLPVTIDEMLHHTAAVVRGTEEALVVADLPFMSYQVSEEQALTTAGRFIKEAGADAVKIEGGAFRAPVVRRLVQNGIPVLGHIGLMPQSVKEVGGYRVQGRDDSQAEALCCDAEALADAGVFALVLECVPASLGSRLTEAVGVPTIGIGAGPGCDGQILVTHDLLGLTLTRTPKFVKPYAQLGETIRSALGAYAREVLDGSFPDGERSY